MNDVMQGRWTLLHVIGLVVWQKHVKSLSLSLSHDLAPFGRFAPFRPLFTVLTRLKSYAMWTTDRSQCFDQRLSTLSATAMHRSAGLSLKAADPKTHFASVQSFL